MFTFNGDYNDFAQVAEYIGDFARVRAEIIEAGQYPYNASFEGRIPGEFNRTTRKNVEGDHETAAIYMLQCLYRAWEIEARVLDLLAKGYRHITYLDEIKRFQHVVLYPTDRHQGEWAEYEGARLLPETNERQTEVTGRIRGVLPKGKRTRGYLVNGRNVLVLP